MASQNTLTAPADRNSEHKFNFNQPVLTPEETQLAAKELVNRDALEVYPKTERAFADPAIDDQEYCLVSFIPSVTAKPDKDGIYGMIKVRGTYNTLEKCDKRSEFLIKNIDSVHHIYYAGVGKPFPITNSSNFSKDISKIKIQEKLAEERKFQEDKEKREVQEIKQREKEILESSNEEKEPENEDKYITLKVKKAQLTWTYISTMKKLLDMKNNILKARDDISKLDQTNPEFKDSYMERYKESLKRVNLQQDKDSFISYMENDGIEELGF